MWISKTKTTHMHMSCESNKYEFNYSSMEHNENISRPNLLLVTRCQKGGGQWTRWQRDVIFSVLKSIRWKYDSEKVKFMLKMGQN